ncbi:MAG: HPr(Ser) kinase/phosphatase [Oscillospiraceae bacterium]|nr:HPr(Ser) kinase/phosphatase [Oscillospiraceae bacterium]
MDNGMKLKDLVKELGFKIVYKSADYDEVVLGSTDISRPAFPLTGFYEGFDHTRIQLLGGMEFAYLRRYKDKEIEKKFDSLFSHGIPAILWCHDVEPMPACLEMAKKYDVTVLSTSTPTSDCVSNCIRTLRKAAAQKITRHGVLVEVYGMGLLLMGESGVGKSETAIELMKRGHRLIADDAVEITAVDLNVLEGAAPELIRYYVELRGIGVIDTRQIFGMGAVKPSQRIDLIVNLEPWTEGIEFDRIGLTEKSTTILGIEVPTLSIPVKTGRNLAIIIEVAAMNHRQKMMGYNAAVEFTKQLNRAFERK